MGCLGHTSIRKHSKRRKGRLALSQDQMGRATPLSDKDSPPSSRSLSPHRWEFAIRLPSNRKPFSCFRFLLISRSHKLTIHGPKDLDPYPSPEVSPITVTDTVEHSYASAGTYTITLTVTDDDGGIGLYSLSLTL